MILLPGTAGVFASRMINNLLGREKTDLITLVNTHSNGLTPELPDEQLAQVNHKLELKPYSFLSEAKQPFSEYDLMILTVEEWKSLFANKPDRLEHLPSVLILQTKGT
jgi:hypothetical protein